jgi:hypothetical protein
VVPRPSETTRYSAEGKKRLYLLDTEPLTRLSCSLNAVFQVLHGTVPQDSGIPLLLLLQNFNLFKISVALLENVSPTPVYRKEHIFYTNCRSGRDWGSNPGRLRGRQQLKPLSHPI